MRRKVRASTKVAIAVVIAVAEEEAGKEDQVVNDVAVKAAAGVLVTAVAEEGTDKYFEA